MRDTAENRCMFDEENDKTNHGICRNPMFRQTNFRPKVSKQMMLSLNWLVEWKSVTQKIRKPAFLPNNGFPLLPLSLLDQFIIMSGMMWAISEMVLLCAEDFANIQTHLEIKQIVGNLYEPSGSWEFPNRSHFGRGNKKKKTPWLRMVPKKFQWRFLVKVFLNTSGMPLNTLGSFSLFQVKIAI